MSGAAELSQTLSASLLASTARAALARLDGACADLQELREDLEQALEAAEESDA